MSDGLYCERGCWARGYHRRECSRLDCRGCAPRLAAEGRLCARCAGRLVAALNDVVPLARHLRFLAEPSIQSPAGHSGGGGGVPGSKSLYAAQLDFVDQMSACVGTWALYVNERMQRGRLISDMRLGLVGWHFTDLFSNNEVLRLDAIALEEAMGFLIGARDFIMEQQWVADFFEIVDWVDRGWRLWPWEEHTRLLPLPCPACDSMSLAYRPPSFARMPAIVTCTLDECGKYWADREWTELVHQTLIGQGVKV